MFGEWQEIQVDVGYWWGGGGFIEIVCTCEILLVKPAPTIGDRILLFGFTNNHRQ